MPTFERPTNIGKYEILATLGRGGMGVVYKARDPVIDRIVAIKTILVGEEVSEDDNLADRLTMEARSAGRLHHPNIVTVFDFGKEGELSYIVMEYVEGINLARIIDERRPLPLDTKISLIVQIANGLAYAHERGVIHRDMKPANVCIASPGTAKILDFGLARFDSTRLTKTGYMAGTIAYMSPERLSGTTGASDDIFALGAVAYEVLAYQRAFPGATPPEVFGKILGPVPPAAPYVAPAPTSRNLDGSRRGVGDRGRSSSFLATGAGRTAASQTKAAGQENRRTTPAGKSGRHRAAARDRAQSHRRASAPETQR